MLIYESKTTPISIEDFVTVIQSSFAENDQDKVFAIQLNQPLQSTELSTLGQSYWTREKNLRNELVRLRAAAHQKDAKNYLVDPEIDPYILDVANSAFKAESPYDAEMVLNEWRWNFLSELEAGHFYDVDFFVAYYIKLQILNRKNSFSNEKGNNEFKQIYQSVIADRDDQAGE